jgi:4-diphosphocytidyl-2-C-methyl-D-erythritol kinase
MISSITLLSPAKINLTLEVIGKRQDGYHEIRSIVQLINLFDEVRIEVEDGEGIMIETTGLEVPKGKENLAWRAAEVFLKECGLSFKIKIDIKKRIPLGAGLGGGSGNAGAVLHGLNRITKRLNVDELIRLSSKVGADVPLFIHCRSSIIQGIGDKVTVIRSFPLYYYVILNPGFEVSTKKIYELWDEVYKGEGLIRDSIENKIALFRRGVFPLMNDLEKAAISLHPEIKTLKENLMGMGLKAVSMTGSGPTVFGVFHDEKDAKRVYEYFRDSSKFKVFFAQGISGWHRL